VKWVILGHSERRIVYNEGDAVVNAKVLKAQSLKLNTIICIGENAEQRESEQTNEVIKTQLNAIKDSISDWNLVVLAYEPVWAAEGANVTTEAAEAACLSIRTWVSDNVNPDISQAVRIQYAGRVNAAKAKDLIACENIDGFLLGDESLTNEFLEIIEVVNQPPEEGA